MIPVFPVLPHSLGVYALTRLLELRENSALYEAQQAHMDRAVILEILKPDADQAEEVAFLSMARYRVANSGLPHIAKVFESLRADGLWFLTQELPPGRSVADVTAAQEPLSVQLLCSIISSAAEMYTGCGSLRQHAMPLTGASIYVEENGAVHFLSPLNEGADDSPKEQMQTLAAILWPLCPQDKTPGLGRLMTLLQWLAEGYEGTFFQWSEIHEISQTILTQLQSDSRPEHEQSASSRLKARLNQHPGFRKFKEFTSQWGRYIGAAGCTIAAMTGLGTLFGMADPQTIPAVGESSVLCNQAGQHVQVMRFPVSVQKYAEFMRQFDQLSAPERQKLLSQAGCEDAPDLTPLNWEKQQDFELSPVTGVNFWQATLCALSQGGQLPTAAQLQTIQAAGVELAEMEWTRDSQDSPLPGIYEGTAYLMVNQQGIPVPVDTQEWGSPQTGFRITFPENN